MGLYGGSGVEKKGVNGFGVMFCLMRLLIKTLKHRENDFYWGTLMEEQKLSFHTRRSNRNNRNELYCELTGHPIKK